MTRRSDRLFPSLLFPSSLCLEFAVNTRLHSFACCGALLLLCAAAPAQETTWSTTASGLWLDAANWSSGIPDAPGAVAIFPEGLTETLTLTIDGAPATVGALQMDNPGKTVQIRAANGGSLLLDGGAGASRIDATGSGNLQITAPTAIADGSTLEIANAGKGDVKLSGALSGENIILSNSGSGSGYTYLHKPESGNHTFTGEVWAVSGTSRISVGDDNIEEPRMGDRFNAIRIFPGALLTLARYGNAIVHPCRTVWMESGETAAMATLSNPGENNEKKNVPAPILGEGSICVTGNYALSGDNPGLSGGIQLDGKLQISDPRNIGGAPVHVRGHGTTLLLAGTQFTRASENLNLRFTVDVNGGSTLRLLDPACTFVLDQPVSLSLNSNGATPLNKNGPGTLIFEGTHSLLNNDNAKALAIGGGRVIIPWAETGDGLGSSPDAATCFRPALNGGELRFTHTDEADFHMGDLVLMPNGGMLTVEGAGAAPVTLNLRGFALFRDSEKEFGRAASLRTAGTGVFCSSVTNDASGIWGGGRFTFNGADWPAADTNGVLHAYADYAAFGDEAADGDGGRNLVLSGTAEVGAGETRAARTLKLDTAAQGAALSFGEGAVLALADNALLATGGGTATLRGGSLQLGRAENDAIVHVDADTTLRLSQVALGDANRALPGLTKAGKGTLVLDPAPAMAGALSITDGTVVFPTADAIPYSSGTLTGVTAATDSATIQCAMDALPAGFGIGASSLLGLNVSAVSGTPGDWTITLSGNANAALTNSTATYNLRPTIRNNGCIRFEASTEVLNTLHFGGNDAAFDVADGQTVTFRDGSLYLCTGGFVLNNTDPVGDGLVAFNREFDMGYSLRVLRGIFRHTGDNFSRTGQAPVQFGNGIPATLQLRGGRTVLCAELTASNTAARVETYSSGATLFGVLNGTDNTFAGVIADGPEAGTIRFTKAGAGKLTLSNTHAYSGATVVQGGTLRVDGSIRSSASLLVEGHGTIEGDGAVPATRIGRGGALGVGPGSGALALTSLAMDPQGALRFAASAAATSGYTPPHVEGDAVVDGLVCMAEPDALQPGAYTLLTVEGQLTDAGLRVDPETVPADRRVSVIVAAHHVTLTCGLTETLLLVR